MRKTAAILLAAGALASVSVPAMAFENEFHGSYKLRYFLSNYEQGGGGNPFPVLDHAINRSENPRLNNYFEQRSRLFYTAKANDDLKLVTAFEIDSVWGDKAQSQGGRNFGGGLESDSVNLETKWMYLQFKVPSTPTTMLVGIMPVKDSLKGIFLDADIAGILTSTKLGNATLNAGYFRAYDATYMNAEKLAFPLGLGRGQDNLDIGAVEAKYALSKDANVGAVYYIYNDGRQGTFTGLTTFMAHVAGLTGDIKLGALSLSGFGAYQGGILRHTTPSGETKYLNAFAGNLAAKMPVGPGTLKSAFLYTTGNDYNMSTNTVDHNKHLTGWIGTTQSQGLNGWAPTTGTSTYNESGMMLLNRNAAAGTGTTDMAIVYNTGNGKDPLTMQGVYLYTLGYDATINPKLYANVNAGLAWSAKTNTLKPWDKAIGGTPPVGTPPGAPNASNFMGAEFNIETGYKVYDNLTASLQAAYVILGGYYNNSMVSGTNTSPKDPENPYTVRTSLIFNF